MLMRYMFYATSYLWMETASRYASVVANKVVIGGLVVSVDPKFAGSNTAEGD
jgi:hypothetical protein